MTGPSLQLYGYFDRYTTPKRLQAAAESNGASDAEFTN